MFNQFNELFKSSLKPLDQLVELNISTVNSVAHQQGLLIANIIDESISYSRHVSTDIDLSIMVSDQGKFGSEIQNQVFETVKQTVDTITQAQKSAESIISGSFATFSAEITKSVSEPVLKKIPQMTANGKVVKDTVAPKAAAKVAPKAAAKVAPKVEAKAETKVMQKAAAKVAPKTAAKVTPKVAAKAETKVTPKVTAKAETKVTPKVTAKAETKVTPKAAAKVAPKVEAKAETKVTPKAAAKVAPKVEAKAETKVTAKAAAEVAPKVEAKAETKVTPKA
ncbi:hypothetical protein A9Q74_08385 [Colwellia sp. 39_35_sub15_T18]|nr:hypothetical protein A9Q74_08385 [Colwellia sp. 39_35_sub15_T18]